MIDLNACIMEYSPTLCFVGFLSKKVSSNKKSTKLAKAELSRQNFKMSRHNVNKTSRNFVTTSNFMSQQIMEAKLKLEVSYVATIHNFVATQHEKD